MARQRPGDGNERLVVTVLALSVILGSVQFTLLVPVLPQIPIMLDTTAGNATWLVTATLLVSTIGTPVMARLADMYGRRRLLVVAMVLLVAGSVIAAVGSTVFAVVLIGRSLQGFASSILPIGIGLLSGLVGPARLRFGIALMSGSVSLGSGLGLALSGPLFAWGGLPAIFWASAVMGILLLVLVLWCIDESLVRDPGRFDFIGTLLLAVGLSLALLVISRLPEWGLSLVTIGTLAVGALALGLWLPWERRHLSPVIDVKVSMGTPVAQINVASFFATFGMYANHLITMQEALAPPQTGYGLGLPIATAGFILVPSTLAGLFLSGPASRTIWRIGASRTLALGTIIMTFAYILRFFLHGDVVQLVIGSTLVGIGTAYAFASMPSLITESVAPSQTSAANGVNSLARSLSGAVASATLGLVLAVPATSGGIYLSSLGLQMCLALAGLAAAFAAFLALRLPTPTERKH